MQARSHGYFTARPLSDYLFPVSRTGNIIHMASAALAQSFMANREPLLRYLRARGAGEEAEDVLQELWVKLQADVTGIVADPRSYLYRMAHNLMLDRRRSLYRRQRREDAYHTDGRGPSGDVDDAPTAERVLIARERLEAIDRTLAGLGERTDYIFRRHRVENVPQKEIAADLGITLSGVEKHLQKAYRAIAEARFAAIHEGDGESSDDIR